MTLRLRSGRARQIIAKIASGALLFRPQEYRAACRADELRQRNNNPASILPPDVARFPVEPALAGSCGARARIAHPSLGEALRLGRLRKIGAGYLESDTAPLAVRLPKISFATCGELVEP